MFPHFVSNSNISRRCFVCSCLTDKQLDQSALGHAHRGTDWQGAWRLPLAYIVLWAHLYAAHTAGYELHTERHLTRETCSAVRLRWTNMTERFVVLPVSQCCDIEEQELNYLHNNQELLPVIGGVGDLDEPEVVPILQYNREPNKYGEWLTARFAWVNWRINLCVRNYPGFKMITTHCMSIWAQWIRDLWCQVGEHLYSKDIINRMSFPSFPIHSCALEQLQVVFLLIEIYHVIILLCSFPPIC